MSSSSRARWFIVVIAISASLISVRAEEEPGTQGVIAPLTSGPWYEHGYVGTSPNVTGYNNYDDQCLLWNSTCGGSRSLALNNFFSQWGTLWHLVYHPCEYPAHAVGGWCQNWLAPPPISSAIKSWMREPECLTSFAEWHSAHPGPNETHWTHIDWDWANNAQVTQTIDWAQVTATSTIGCCDSCMVFGGNVDVFYWPVSDAKTDCVSQIGTSYDNIDAGFFTYDERGNKYFRSRPNPYDTDTNTITQPPPPIITSAPQRRLRQRSVASGWSSLLAQNGSITANETIPGSVAYVSGYSLTSPTVYVGFSNLEARDRCGTIDDDISYTVLPFQPGELSTLQVPNWQRGAGIPASLTRSFNFADIPCPPQDVMIADQYKPGPGNPYRPVLAAPSQLQNLRPGWRYCDIVNAFQGIDPPRALKAGSVIIAEPTPTSPSPDHINDPSPGQSPPFPEATAVNPPEAPPKNPPPQNNPPQNNPPQNNPPQSNPPQNPPQQNDPPQNQPPTDSKTGDPKASNPKAGDPNSGNPKAGDPKAGDSKPAAGNTNAKNPPRPKTGGKHYDPSNLSPEQMSAINGALQPASHQDPNNPPAFNGAGGTNNPPGKSFHQAQAPHQGSQGGPAPAQSNPRPGSKGAQSHEEGSGGRSDGRVSPPHSSPGENNHPGPHEPNNPTPENGPENHAGGVSNQNSPVDDNPSHQQPPSEPKGSGGSGSNQNAPTDSNPPPQQPPNGPKDSEGGGSNQSPPAGSNSPQQPPSGPKDSGASGSGAGQNAPPPKNSPPKDEIPPNLSPSVGPSGEIVYYSTPPAAPIINHTPTPTSTEKAQPHLSPSLGPSNNVLYYSTRPDGSKEIISSRTIPPGISASHDSSGDLVYYSPPPPATPGANSPSPGSQHSPAAGSNGEIKGNGNGGAGAPGSRQGSGQGPGSVPGPAAAPVPILTEHAPPHLSPSVLPPSHILTYFSTGPNGAIKPVSTKAVAPGLSASIVLDDGSTLGIGAAIATPAGAGGVTAGVTPVVAGGGAAGGGGAKVVFYSSTTDGEGHSSMVPVSTERLPSTEMASVGSSGGGIVYYSSVSGSVAEASAGSGGSGGEGGGGEASGLRPVSTKYFANPTDSQGSSNSTAAGTGTGTGTGAGVTGSTSVLPYSPEGGTSSLTSPCREWIGRCRIGLSLLATILAPAWTLRWAL